MSKLISLHKTLLLALNFILVPVKETSVYVCQHICTRFSFYNFANLLIKILLKQDVIKN